MRGAPLYLPEFWEDLVARCRFYESRRPGLSARFASIVYACRNQVVEFPQAWGTLKGDYHKVLLRPFKDLMVYRLTPDRIYFIGIVHGARNLSRWLNRRVEEE